MKCKECSKLIPDGFTDCPWCGAKPSAAGAAPSDASEVVLPPTHNLVIGTSIVASGVLFGMLSYFAATRSAGPLSLENSGYFLGRCLGSILLAAIVVAVYCKVRASKPRGPVQVLVVLTLSSLLTLLTLALPVRPRMEAIDPATVRRYSDEVRPPKNANSEPVVRTKWDPANRSLMKDIAARNQQYVSEISALDETAKPLYTPESFRGGATIQQMIDQLHARIAVADKYRDWQPIFSRMKDYVGAVDASDDEKRKFLAGVRCRDSKNVSSVQRDFR